MVRGFHVYRHSWTPHVGQQLQTERESDNREDHFAVAVMKAGEDGSQNVVGHLPRELRYCCPWLDWQACSCVYVYTAPSLITSPTLDDVIFYEYHYPRLLVEGGSNFLSMLYVWLQFEGGFYSKCGYYLNKYCISWYPISILMPICT